MLLLLMAAFLKLLGIREFAADLRTWTVIPAALHAPLSLGIPLVEGGAALAWFFGLAHQAALVTSIALMVSFTAAYALQAILVGPPRCGCFGAVFRHEQTIELAWLLVARNTALMATLTVGGVAAVRKPLRAPHSKARALPVATHTEPGASTTHPTGFTILELLVVIAIIAIVMSLTVPSLARIRGDARELKSLANLRTHAVCHTAYTGDNDGVFLHVSDPNATSTILRGGGVTIAIPYFYLFSTWNIALADDYYGGDAMPDCMRVPWKQPFMPYTHYYYGDCFIA
jgi:prepilin-type N-terminal cleavage/methylation domain-containing protein